MKIKKNNILYVGKVQYEKASYNMFLFYFCKI